MCRWKMVTGELELRTRQFTTAGRQARVLLVMLLAVASMLVGGVLAPARVASATAPNADSWAFLNLTNQSRANAGLPPLKMQPDMVNLAAAWTSHMVGTQNLVHNYGLGGQVASIFPDWKGYGENIGYGQTVDILHQAFMNSPSHRDNVLGDFNYVGIYAQRDAHGTLWVTLDFLKLDRAVATISPMSLSEARSLVKATYNDFFHRSPSSSELSTWAGALSSGGIDQTTFLNAIVTSPEWVSQLVTGYYQDTLGRAPDSGGLSYWVSLIRGGMSPAEVAAHFYGSAEYFARSGGTNDGYVRSLYAALLGRSPETAGLNYWKGRLNRGEPRDRIAYEFYQSVESRGRRVRGLYQQLLGRSPDAGGLNYWIGQLADGNDLRLALNLASSAEYRARAMSRFPS